MPSTFAHQYFGDLVWEQLKEQTKALALSEGGLYDIGLQGPDIFFYYNPLRKGDPVARIGTDKHNMTGRDFFKQAMERIASSGLSGAEKDAAHAYLCGVICHFALDASLHARINLYEAEGGANHAETEGELDRALIASLGRDPVKEKMTEKFIPSAHCARAISGVYTEAGEETILKALRSFVDFHKILYCPGDLKRDLLFAGLRLIGKYESLHGHITNKTPDVRCEESSRVLIHMLNEAVPAAAGMADAFAACRNEAPDTVLAEMAKAAAACGVKDLLERDYNGITKSVPV